MADILEDIKARLDIVEVVSQYVQLKKMGRNYKALCPFHSEKTPSFVVSQEKQICHCFGCNKGGDIFGFIKEVEGVEFPEAIQILADRAGIKIENFSKFSKDSKKIKSEKDEYFRANALACEFFEKKLFNTSEGKKVIEYLYKRGLKDETIKEFRIGYAPDKFDELHPYLLNKGIHKKVLITSGLAATKNITSDEIYDKFRGRLMFPIFDYLGRICGFGGRICDFLKQQSEKSEAQQKNHEQGPKYLNSAENPIYNKSRVLYGLYHSKQHIKEKDQIILVEGYFDVILPYQEGVKNIAAISGTALTNYQAGLIKRFTSNVVSCFDLDEAGFEATKRAYSVLQSENLLMKIVSGFKGKDPADLVLEKGGNAFISFIEKAEGFIEFFIDKLLRTNDISTLEGRRAFFNEILPLYKRMSSPADRDFYVRLLTGKLNIKEQFIYDEIAKLRLPLEHPARQLEEKPLKFMTFEDVIFAIVLKYPFLFGRLNSLAKIEFFDGEYKDIYKELSDQYNTVRTEIVEWRLDKGFLAKIKAKVDILLLYAEENYDNFSEENLVNELGKLVDRVKKRWKTKCLEELHKKIVEAEKVREKRKLIELLKEQQKLLSE